MQIQATMLWSSAMLLCALRLGAMLLMTPLLDGFSVPVRIKTFLLLALSATLVSALRLHPAAPPHDLPALLAMALAELATGALMGFGIHTAFNAVAFAGKILDIQLGFGMGNVYDPVTRAQAPLLGSIIGILALLLFFLSDAHHVLLRGLAASFEHIPLGRLPSLEAPEAVLRQFGMVFSMGLLLAAPAVFCLFLLELGLAVLSRVLPQMNVFIVSVPAKIAAGFFILSLLGRGMSDVMLRTFHTTFQFWEALF
jgi:flagellar biosynthetic protein FliR